jgi:hypothetical protein
MMQECRMSLLLFRRRGPVPARGCFPCWRSPRSVAIVPWFAARARSRVQAITLGLLLGGAAGNLWDRLFRAPAPGRGRVVDFIDYHGWFIGNVADIAIVAGAGILIVRAMTPLDREQRNPLRVPPPRRLCGRAPPLRRPRPDPGLRRR